MEKMGKVKESVYYWPPVDPSVLPFSTFNNPIRFVAQPSYPLDFARPQQSLQHHKEEEQWRREQQQQQQQMLDSSQHLQHLPTSPRVHDTVPMYQMISEQVKEGYQIPPWGVTLHPVSSTRSFLPISPSSPSPSPCPSSPSPSTASTPPFSPNPPSSPMVPAPNSPATPMDSPAPLSPLSCGGYIYHYPAAVAGSSSASSTSASSSSSASSNSTSPALPPPQPPHFVQPPSTPHFTTNSPSFVSAEIAERQAKLEKYREKRMKRNFNRPVDQGRRERAVSRTRDEHGQFVSEKGKVRQALEESQKESMMLRSRLSAMEQELAEMRKREQDMVEYKAEIQKQLEAQQQMNEALMQENTMLWSSVPMSEVFSTINPSNPTFVEPFKEKIDFSSIELNWTDSPFLEEAREGDALEENRWEEDLSVFADPQS